MTRAAGDDAAGSSDAVVRATVFVHGFVQVDAVAYHMPGHTASGLPVGVGVVAVDPSVIPLGTRLFVPGYGPAVAADVGSAIEKKGPSSTSGCPPLPRRGPGGGAPSRSPSTVSRWMVRTRLALLVVLCLVVAPAVSPSAGAGTEDLTARLTKSLRSGTSRSTGPARSPRCRHR